MKANSIMTKAAVLLQDAKHTRWPLSELASWIDEGVSAIVMVRPPAGSANIVLDLVLGTRQALPSDPSIVQLLDVERNIAGGIPGRSVSRATRADLDAFNPNWHNPAKTPYKAEVRQFTYDTNAPREFFVYPGNTGDGRLDACVSKLPATLASRAPSDPTAIAGWALDVGLDEVYAPALLDYVMYRAFLKETPEASPSRAMGHYQAFATALGVQAQTNQTQTPGGR